MKKRIRRSFYTLVEIMTVIVIAAILFGIGIPAFTTMIQGSNMTVAIRQLSAKMQAARAYAVTNRCKVAVLLVDASGAKDDYLYSAYRVCVVDKDNKWQEWIEDENWKTLPKGVLRYSVSPTTSVTDVNGSEIGGASSVTYPALIFKENGQMVNASSTLTLRQGRYVSGNRVYTERNGDGKIISHPIEANQYSGKVTVKTITETNE